MLEIRALRKSFGGVVANDAISIEVPRHSIIGLIGPNGSGKTTLFNCIAGQHPVDGGSVRFDGHDLAGLGAAEIARLGLLRTFQHASVYEGMTCLQNMRISGSNSNERFSAMFGMFSDEVTARALDLLAFVKLAEKCDAPAGDLSYGQRKLLELAMALMNDPKMLLLDEPTAGVNPVLIDHLVDRLSRARDAFGVTLMVIEHNMRVVMQLADHIHCLAHGRLLASGPPEAIRGDQRVIDAYLGAR